jgi:hypothetical protein
MEGFMKNSSKSRRKKKAKVPAGHADLKSMHEAAKIPKEHELNLEQAKIGQWLKKLRFRRKLFGGVSEKDVWKKIGELNAMYEASLAAERIRYDTLIEYFKRTGINVVAGREDKESSIEDTSYAESGIKKENKDKHTNRKVLKHRKMTNE